MIQKVKSFKYCNMWAQDESFLPLIQEGWQARVVGMTMFKVVTKLKNLKKVLKSLHRSKSSNVETEAYVALTQLLEIQQNIHRDPHNIGLHQQEAEARRNYDKLKEAKLCMLRQIVKRDWISGGDENSRYFHTCLRKRRHQHYIYRIQDEEGI